MRPIVILTSTGRSSLAQPLRDAGAPEVRVVPPNHVPREGEVVVTRCTGMGKLRQLKIMEAAEVCTVPWTELPEVAQEWMDEGAYVYARKMLNASRGKGIIILNPGDEVTHAPLYTCIVPCKREWRVHYAFGKTAAVKKLLPNGREPSLIRNRKNGYVFSGLRHNERVEALGRQAIKALGYDFGAVDIIEAPDGELYVLEVNRAPGIKSPSAKAFYTQAIIEEAMRE